MQGGLTYERMRGHALYTVGVQEVYDTVALLYL